MTHEAGQSFRVLVTGAGFCNKGAEALLRTTQLELENRLGNLRCMVALPQIAPEDEAAAEELGVELRLPQPLPRMRRLILLAAFMAANPSEWRSRLRGRSRFYLARSMVHAADAVIDASGFRYSDSFEEAGTLEMLPFLDAAKRLSKPYIFLPQSWGPFREGSRISSIVAEACARSPLFFARDEQSRDHLATLLGLQREKVRIAPDVAFLLPGMEEKSSGASAESTEAAPPGTDNFCGISPNLRVYQRLPGKGLDNAYVRSLIAIGRAIRQRKGTIMVIPHFEGRNKNSFDDEALCDLVEAAINGFDAPNRSKILRAQALKTRIGKCQLLIASRFHALVGALSQGVPTVALGWSHKYEELLGDFNLKKFAISLENVGSPDSLQLAMSAWESRRQLRQEVETRLPAIKAKAKIVYDEVAMLLQKGERE